MVELSIGTFLIVAASLFAVHATLGRMFGFHCDLHWSGGGKMAMAGELSIAGFLGSVGGGFATGHAGFFLTVLLCWIALACSQIRANRRFRLDEEMLRAQNSKLHPGVFDVSPPQHLDVDATQQVDVYDCDSSVYIGRIDSIHISDLIQATDPCLPNPGPNDIYVIQEMVEPPALPESNDLQAFLQPHFNLRGHAILRWLPVKKNE